MYGKGIAFVCAVCVFVVTSFGAPAYAEQTDSVAIVDVQRVVSESVIGKAARNNLEREMQKAKVKLSNLQAEIEKQKGELDKQVSILSGAALEDRREALLKKQRDAQRSYQDIQEQLAQFNDKELRKVVDEINSVVKDLAKQRSYEFVFERDRQAVVYAAPRLDITQEVIKELDKRKIDL